MVRLEFRGLLEMRRGLVTVFQGSIGQPQEQMCVGVVGVQLNGRLVVRDCLFVLPHVVIRVAEVQVRLQVAAVELKIKRFLKVFNGMLETALGNVNQAEICIGCCEVGSDRNPLFQEFDRPVVATHVAEGDCEIHQSAWTGAGR